MPTSLGLSTSEVAQLQAALKALLSPLDFESVGAWRSQTRRTDAPAGGGPFDADATHLYFADRWTIKRVSVNGGRAERLAIRDFYISDVATDGAYVYWVEDGPFTTVRKVAVDRGPITTLAYGSGPAGAIRLDPTQVYWSEHLDVIGRVPKEGGNPVTVVGPIPGLLTDFVVDGVSVYFAEWDSARVRKMPIAGGNPTTLALLSGDQTRRLATDGANVYWVDQRDLGKVPVAGEPPAFVAMGRASSPFVPNGIAVDDKSVSWTEVAADVIKMATPK